ILFFCPLVSTLFPYTTLFRSMGWAPHTIEQGDVVLVWGAAGGLGSLALEITRALGGRAIAVVSDDEKKKFCMDHGAHGVVNRTRSEEHTSELQSRFDLVCRLL